jgi:hypothetical protein
MSTRFQHRQIDGDESEMSSALEMAIDSHWCVLVLLSRLRLKALSSTIFLSSSEAQEGESYFSVTLNASSNFF